MLTHKQWKTQCLAERIQNLATSIAAEASRRSVLYQPVAKDVAFIAEETRRMAEYIMKSLERNIFNGFQNSDFDTHMLNASRRASNLALNAGLLACKEKEHLPLAVFAEDLRNFAVQLGEVYGKELKYFDIPKISPKSAVITDMVFLFNATSGKYVWWENAFFVKEIMFYEPEYIQGNRLIIKNEWRNMDMPFIKLGDVPKDPSIVIISDAFDPKKYYAILADFDIHALVNAHAGVNKPCASDIPVRECWSASDGRDIMFLDWNKIAQ